MLCELEANENTWFVDDDKTNESSRDKTHR